MKIRQGCMILVHERGEHCGPRTKYRQRRGGVDVTPLMIAVNSCRRGVQLEIGYTIGIDNPQPNEDCAIDNFLCP